MENQKYSPSQIKGYSIEKTACDYLVKNQLKLIHKNYQSKFGEIDLIMKAFDKQFGRPILVFVEVRYRKSLSYGGALASIDFHKQKKLINTASSYLLKYHPFDPPQCRFDVVLVSGKLTTPNIEWIVNAFE